MLVAIPYFRQAANWQRNHHWGTKYRLVLYILVASCEQKVAQKTNFLLAVSNLDLVTQQAMNSRSSLK